MSCDLEVTNEGARCWEEISSYITTVLVRAVCSVWTFSHFDHLVLQKFYKVPPYSKEIPYTRVNHNKFMVTDSVAYVGTSNWSADYFTGTAGIGYVINETETGNTVRAQLQAVFERNWDSNFTISVNCNQWDHIRYNGDNQYALVITEGLRILLLRMRYARLKNVIDLWISKGF